MLPWRIRNFISNKLPLVYHVFRSLFYPSNNAAVWDKELEASWDNEERRWPTKNALILKEASQKDHILDVACGKGDLLRVLKRNDYTNLWGLEHSSYAVARLSQEGISMIKGSLPQIAAPTDKFDIVVASQVLEHIIRRNHFLKEIKRVLKPSGSAHIFVPDNCLGPIDEPSHVAIYTARSLRKLLLKHFLIEELYSMKDENFEMPILYAKVSKM